MIGFVSKLDVAVIYDDYLRPHNYINIIIISRDGSVINPTQYWFNSIFEAFIDGKWGQLILGDNFESR